MVGHTHEDINQVFSSISVQLRQVNAPPLPGLIETIRDSTDPAPEVQHLEGIFDYKKSLMNCKGAYGCISGTHQFVIHSSSNILNKNKVSIFYAYIIINIF